MRVSEAEAAELMRRARAHAPKRSGQGSDTPKPSKHRSRKCTWDGKSFDSQAERDRYIELVAMEARGEISNLRRQVAIALVVRGVHVCDYVADAIYLDEHGREVVEDTKSAHTRTLPEYRIKFKLYRALFRKEIREYVKP